MSSQETQRGDPLAATLAASGATQRDDLVPARVGRYVVIDRIGGGGMGVVYSAYDPELDRKVAIKLLRSGGVGSEAQARLVREAQAMAALSHPNVVPVHDVGTYEDPRGERAVFIAMELIVGETLRAWLARAPRRWSDVLPLLVQAARGLAAAHDAGIIHRDFKPDNVLVDRKGRVLVADLGVARMSPVSGEDGASLPTGAPELTRPGATVGTPAYMAPEQIEGIELDPRADQFAFCVTMYEALYGERPFQGESIVALCHAILHGRMVSPATNVRVPAWLHRTMLRGLSRDRRDRWLDMNAMIAELERDRGRTARRVAMAFAGAVLAIALGRAWITTRDDPCPPAEDLLVDAWGPARRNEIERAIRSTDVPYASDTWTSVAARVDAFAEQWVRVRTEACEAANVRGDESSELFDRRVACLEERRTALTELSTLLADADTELVRRAIELTDELLPRVETCSDAAALLARVPPPEDPELAARVAEIRDGLVHVRALSLAADYDQALHESDRICEASGCDDDAAAYAPLRSEALLRRADVLESLGRFPEVEAPLRNAFNVALAAGHDEVVDEAASQLIPLLGLRLDRRDEGEHWIGTARAAQERSGASHHAQAELANNVALVRHAAGDFDGAVRELERGLALLDEDDDARRRAMLESNLCNSLRRLGRLDEAADACARSLELRTAVLGARHPETAETLVALGNVAKERGDYGGAIGHYEAALAIQTETFGDDSPQLLEALVNLGNVADMTGDHARAETALLRALAIQRRALASDHTGISTTLLALGILDSRRGRPLLARVRLEEALALRELKHGAEHAGLAVVLVNLGSLDTAEGRFAEAERHYRRALQIRERALGRDHAAVAYVLTGLGQTQLAAGRPTEAIAALERALAIRERAGVEPVLLATTRFALARALAAAGTKRERWLGLAEAAHAELARSQLLDELAEVERWLSAHPG